MEFESLICPKCSNQLDEKELAKNLSCPNCNTKFHNKKYIAFIEYLMMNGIVTDIDFFDRTSICIGFGIIGKDGCCFWRSFFNGSFFIPSRKRWMDWSHYVLFLLGLVKQKLYSKKLFKLRLLIFQRMEHNKKNPIKFWAFFVQLFCQYS